MICPGRFDGRSAIVTGGASGLGLEAARRIVAEGGRVALWDIDPDWLETARQEIGATHAVAFDVTDREAVEQAAAASHEALGAIDVLVNSAGITGATAPVENYPVDSWLGVIDVNLNGVFYCCRAVLPFMLARGYGRIVNVASVAGKEGNPFASAYSASKAGVIGFTKSLGKELATRGVIANAVTPATFESPILQQLPKSQVEYMRSKIPMGRLGDVRETAAMVCFMASEECSFTTGATFDTSGGRTTF
jgi:3-oxoacyl-[acyl-carrier protein] reductase